MTATTVLVLVLAGLLGVLLLVHRSDGDLLRAVVEYAVVAVLALLLAFAPATRDASAGVTAGVSSGSAALGRLVADAWQRAFGDRQAAGAPAAPAPTRPTPKATRPPRATRPTTPPASAPTPTPAPAARPGVPLPAGVGLLVAVALLGLVVLAWRIRRLDRRDPLELGLARLPRSGGRRRRAA
jgi:hypothetical protein